MPPVAVTIPDVVIPWLKSHVSVEFVHSIVLSGAPLSIIPPPSAVVSSGLATEPNSIFLSSTVRVVLLIVVTSPSTVKLPLSVRFTAVAVPVNAGDASGA